MGFLWSLALSIQFLILHSLFSSTIINCFPFVQPTQCHEDESSALLQFKEGFVISKSASYNPFSYPKIASWMPSTDCCSWEGIECDQPTGHVTGIDLSSSQLYGSLHANSSLFRFVHLQRLDLSDNDFNSSQIPSKIGELSKLRYLNLSQPSETTFSGEIPPEVSQLSNLLTLDLRSYTVSIPRNPINLLRLKISNLRRLIQNSTRLEALRLNFVTISSSVPDILTNLTSLQKLSLRHCELYGEFPVGIFHLPNLRILNLGDNQNLIGMLPDFHSSSFISMLNLAGTSFYGTLPASIGNLSSLNALIISQSNFSGSIPSSLSNLTQLTDLELGGNRFTIETISWICNLSKISYLDLASTNIGSEIPLCFANLTQLSHLSLPNSNLSGEIPSWIMNLTNLAYLDLDKNSLHGEIPHSLFRVENLATLSLQYNLLQGQLELDMFLKFKMLTYLDLSSNKLSLLTGKSSSNVTLSRIRVLALDSCNSSGEIPSWIMNLSNLTYLSLEDNNLHGEIPHSLFGLENLAYLSLRNNLLQGQLELDMFLKLKKLTFLVLSSNKLSLLSRKISSNVTSSQIQVLALSSCNLVEFPNFLQDLDELACLNMSYNSIKSLPNWIWRKRSLLSLSVSYNSLTGEISPLICNLKSLVRLDLSFNNLSGTIPSCLGCFSQSLKVLMLQGNKLFGLIPQTYMIRSALKMIDFSSNNLQGQLPKALVNCRMLEYLDVSYNQINDSFPFWLGDLPELKVIALRYNEFYGAIRCPRTCTFPKLHIIDLSHNEFSGNFPSEIFQNWKSMRASNMSQLQYEPWILFLHPEGQQWFEYNAYSFTMSNKGMVMVYETLQQFYSMIAIDLSSNRISGEIPDVIGDLKGIVSLDLSNNMLTGSIPSSLGKLSNLEALDLSLNSLSGKIPEQLTELTFLEFFNVSFNNLSGPIPQDKQFLTFEGSSFEGNPGLCGNQLLKKCDDHAGSSYASPPAFDGDQDSGSLFEFDWKVVVIGYGGGLVAGLALGSTFSLEKLGWLGP